MKFKLLFCSKIWVYLTEIPVIILFLITRSYNDSSTSWLKLYPLLIFLALVMLFIVIYFFRVITVSFDEIRYHGLFSSRDSAIINKGKTLIITMKSAKRLTVELFGNDGQPPMLDWLKGEDYVPVDIYLFRGKAIGGRKTVSSVLKFFSVTEEDLALAFSEDSFSGDYEYVTLQVNKKEDVREFRITMKETL